MHQHSCEARTWVRVLRMGSPPSRPQRRPRTSPAPVCQVRDGQPHTRPLWDGKNLNLLNWPLLVTRRARVKLHLLHKAKSQSIEIPTTDLDWEEAPPQSQISINRTSTRSSRLNYPIPHSNVNSHLHSFFPSTVRLWNSLPEEVQSLKSYSSFQQTLKSTHISRTYTTL